MSGEEVRAEGGRVQIASTKIQKYNLLNERQLNKQQQQGACVSSQTAWVSPTGGGCECVGKKAVVCVWMCVPCLDTPLPLLVEMGVGDDIVVGNHCPRQREMCEI